ncbi:hypothetical protein L596_024792 [Steinernema carpocapsae]|uniref:Uncharacterized protein n=1 Tax=Steinernema carpocapsae TaxID=34508 RepID=A0A4U5M5S9_STECR|nr:hypothetical protein L596_024792 [Steinernema carpocapsae]
MASRIRQNITNLNFFKTHSKRRSNLHASEILATHSYTICLVLIGHRLKKTETQKTPQPNVKKLLNFRVHTLR